MNPFSYMQIVARGQKPSGFPDRDKEILQALFDEEFKADVENRIARRNEARRRALQQATLKRRRQLMEKTLQEEQDELVKNPQVAMMIDLIKDNMTADTVKIDVNSISARSLAKAMWANNTITCLDLSTNQINDHAGSYIARILKRNNTLKKLDLDNNQLGPKTCQAFGESLKINNSLQALNLDSNPLTGPSNNHDFVGIEQFADSLTVNTSLTSINLWRTGIHSKGGSALAKALLKNSSILFFDVGHNAIDMCDMKDIANKLDNNLICYQDKERRRRNDMATDQEREQKRIDAENALKKQQELQKWLALRREQRAEERRQNEVRITDFMPCLFVRLLYVFQEQRIDAERKEFEENQRLEHMRLEAEAKAREEAEAKKAKKKDKKKK